MATAKTQQITIANRHFLENYVSTGNYLQTRGALRDMASGIAITLTQKTSQILPRIASVVKPALGNVSVKRPIPGQLDPAASEGATEAGHAPLSLVSAVFQFRNF